jgi:hypothetical protein
MRKGYIFITKSGYDPEVGKHVKDPYLGEIPTFGACRPDLRKNVMAGDYLFVVSGKVRNIPQYIMGAFEVDDKLDSSVAFARFPKQHLHKREDGQLDGNIILDSQGEQHPLDNHKNFEGRKNNYVVCKKESLVLKMPSEILRGREKTMAILQEIFGKAGTIPWDIIGRMSKLDDQQVTSLLKLLQSLKTEEKERVMKAVAGRYGNVGNNNRPQPTR